MILTEKDILRRKNSIHRFNLRQIEKNRFPVKCACVVCGEGFLCWNIGDYIERQYYLGPDKRGDIRHVCFGCDLTIKVNLAAATLYRLICAVAQSERDREEIYPADFSTAFIPLAQRTNWPTHTLAEWLRQGILLCGVSSRAALGFDGLSLRDYSEPVRLRLKGGGFELVTRQKAAGPVQYILVHLIGLPVIDTRWALYLAPPRTQQVLKRIGRYYKNSCWFPDLDPRRLFDKAQALSWKKLRRWKSGDRPFNWDPNNDWLLEKQENRKTAARVFIGHRGYWDKPFWLRSHKRHADLKETRKTYNDKHGSYWNSARDNIGCANLTKIFRALGSLNIPHETTVTNGIINRQYQAPSSPDLASDKIA